MKQDGLLVSKDNDDVLEYFQGVTIKVSEDEELWKILKIQKA